MLPRIVLVEPQGALNVGSVARVMMNFGFNELFLVNPRCDPQSEDAFKMATHAKEILQKAKIVESFETALQGCTRVIATTAQQRHRNRQLEDLQLPFAWLVQADTPNAIIFGAEDRGLSNEELEWAQRWVRIPTGSYQTLNLAQSVAICCYEMFKIGLPSTNFLNALLFHRALLVISKIYWEVLLLFLFVGLRSWLTSSKFH